MSGFFRYPGGKSKLKDQIVAKIEKIANGEKLEYREPFFGGGSIGLLTIEKIANIKHIWLNDFDLGISCLWRTLIQNPEYLKKLVENFKPSIEYFDKFKSDLTDPKTEIISDEDIAIHGFKKLAIHQISYSGLGTKSGGPLGGREQKSNYKIDCRWSPSYICKKIDSIHKKFSKLAIRNKMCTNLDFSKVINDNLCNSIIYLDPPYFDKGNDLYQHGLNYDDHLRLSELLKKTNHKWLLSYDDCPEIRDLYSWAKIEEIDGVNYSITALKDKDTGERTSRSKVELLITK